jgi:hypothetical protein
MTDGQQQDDFTQRPQQDQLVERLRREGAGEP